jgi:hypothetical protein
LKNIFFIEISAGFNDPFRTRRQSSASRYFLAAKLLARPATVTIRGEVRAAPRVPRFMPSGSPMRYLPISHAVRAGA